MIIVGLTGPTGAGKGLLSRILVENGIPTLDTDIVARSVCEKGKPCLFELCDNFGKDILNPDGTLNRKKLANMVFLAENKDKKTELLNKTTHKYILEEIAVWLELCKKNAHACAVIDAPLLFKAGLDADCDYTIAVLADKELRINRIIKRDGITSALAEKRASAQESDEFFIKNCDKVYYNNHNEEEFASLVRPLIEKLKRGEIPI